MSCSNYGPLNPAGYLCSMTSAGIGAIYNGVKDNLPSGADVGKNLGRNLDAAFNDFWNEVDLTKNSMRITTEFRDAFEKAIRNANIGNSLKIAADELGDGLEVIRKNGVKEVDLFRSDVQSIFANMARDTTLKMIPWVALGGAVLVGTPMLTMYVYKKAVYNIGRPQLAQESRKVGIWDRTTDCVSRTVSSLWDSTKVGIKWGALAGASGLTLAILQTVAYQIAGKPQFGPQVLHEFGPRTLSGLGCAMGVDNNYFCDSSGANLLIAGAINLGLLRASIYNASNLYGFAKQSIKKDPEPVFHEELQKRIDLLTHATYNINQNGGYMQNLLLYGPGGTGKTMIAKYIAKNSKMNYVMMSGGDLAQYIKRGEHVSELNKIFTAAKSSVTPTILFIDECESLCGDRGKMDRSELIELVNSFLNHTGEPSKKVMVILTTNRKNDLDPAVISRMDHILYIGPPKEAQRKKIIELYLPIFMTSLERKELFTDETICRIAKETKGFTGRTIFKLLNTMSGMRATTNNNKLTEQMIRDIVKAFVKQAAEIEQISFPETPEEDEVLPEVVNETPLEIVLPDVENEITSEEVLPEVLNETPLEIVLPDVEKEITSEEVLPEVVNETPLEIVLPDVEKEIPSEEVLPEIEKEMPTDVVLQDVEKKNLQKKFFMRS